MTNCTSKIVEFSVEFISESVVECRSLGRKDKIFPIFYLCKVTIKTTNPSINLIQTGLANMKCLSVALQTVILAKSPILSSALKCGIKGITKPCLADTDPHYDESIGYAFKDQDAFWAAYEGLYVIESATEYDSVTGEKITSFTPVSFPEDGSLGTYDQSDNKGFVNTTVSGSRLHIKEYRIATHNGDQNVPISLMPAMITPAESFCK